MAVVMMTTIATNQRRQIDDEDVNHIPKDINTELFDEAAKDKMPDNVDLTNSVCKTAFGRR